MSDSFSQLAQLWKRFPDDRSYWLARELVTTIGTFETESQYLSHVWDHYAKRKQDLGKSGEAHLSQQFLRELLDVAITPPQIPNLTFEGVTVPSDAPHAVARYSGSVDFNVMGNISHHDVAIDVLIGIERASGSNPRFHFKVAKVEMDVQPPVEDPDVFPPTDPFAIAKKRVEQRVYRQVLSRLRNANGDGVRLYTISLGQGLPGHRALGMYFWSGLSIFFVQAGGGVLDRTTRDTPYSFAIEYVAGDLESEIRRQVEYRAGDVGNNEASYVSVDATTIQFSATGGSISFNASYDVHAFIGGSKGCNFFYCWDTRMWVGASDGVPIRLDFSTSVVGPRRVDVVMTPVVPNYSAPNSVFYYKNSKLIVDLAQEVVHVRDKARDVINDYVNTRLQDLSSQVREVPLPNLPASFHVSDSDIRLVTQNNQHSLRLSVDFDN